MINFFVTHISLRNFKGISSIDIDLQRDTNVFIGINGCGKSSILFAISLALSQIIAKTGSENKKKPIPFAVDFIKNDENESSISIDIVHKDALFSGKLYQQRYQKKTMRSDLDYAKEIALQINFDLENNKNSSIPIAVFYSVGRNVLDVPLRIRSKHDFDQLSAYSEALLDARKVNDFRMFFEWYRDREDLENEKIRDFANNKMQFDSYKTFDYRDSQLNAVRNAIEVFFPEFHNLHIQRNPLKMVLDKKEGSFDNNLDVNQLSDGEKTMLSMVGDLARRLAIANPSLNNPLDGCGIVLIDEIDLHLHPQWEAEVLTKFHSTFPNCQFIVSTHSPLVLSQQASQNVFKLYRDKNGSIVWHHPEAVNGLTVNEILNSLMDAPDMSPVIKSELDNAYNAIEEEDWSSALRLIAAIRAKTGDAIPELTKVETYLNLCRG